MSPVADNMPAHALMKQSDFFRGCEDRDLLALAGATRFVTYAPDEDIVCEGEDALDVFVVASGEAAVWKEAATAGQFEIARLNPGDSFGEMALLDPGKRSATVRAVSEVKVLAIPIESIVALAQSRPSFVHALVGLARQVAARLRTSNSTAVESLDRALKEERTRTTMGKFTFMLIVTYSLYTWILGTATQMKEMLGRSEFITVPAVIIITGILAWFMRTSGYPASFFGISLRDARRHTLEALAFTFPLMVVAVLLKMLLVAVVPSMQGQPILQMFAEPAPGAVSAAFNPWLTLAYVVFVPFQELIYRGSLQGALAHFLTGKWRSWLAIIGSNIIFSAAHLYISPGLSITAFVAGIFWGWLYARQKTLVGVSVSHVILGFWGFEVVDLGVLE